MVVTSNSRKACAREGAAGESRLVGGRNRHHRTVDPQRLARRAKQARAADHEGRRGAAFSVQPCPRAKDHFRPDPRRITQRDGKRRCVHAQLYSM